MGAFVLLILCVYFFSSLEQFQEEFEDISKEDQVRHHHCC